MSNEDIEQVALYSNDPDWADLKPLPLPQQVGDPFYIQYSKENLELFGYFLALLDKKEVSQRALSLTERVIRKFSAHHTAWWYKFYILENSHYDFDKELQFIDDRLKENPKSYQAWHYRQWLMERIDYPFDDVPNLKRNFEIDAKNFHAWSYALWYAKKWNKLQEIYDLALYEIQQDMRNNSAWSIRKTIGDILEKNPQSELEAAAESLRIISMNEAACNFAIAMVEKDPTLCSRLRDIANEMINRKPENYFARRLLLYLETKASNYEAISTICDELITLDTVRANYYQLLKERKIGFV